MEDAVAEREVEGAVGPVFGRARRIRAGPDPCRRRACSIDRSGDIDAEQRDERRAARREKARRNLSRSRSPRRARRELEALQTPRQPGDAALRKIVLAFPETDTPLASARRRSPRRSRRSWFPGAGPLIAGAYPEC